VPGIDVRTYPAAPEYLQDLIKHKIDAALNDRLMMAYLIKKSPLGPELRKGATVGDYQESGIPFRKGNPKFKQKLDSALNSLKEDGTLKRISLKWFGDIDASQPPSTGHPIVR
jgi:cystine transport system substrate-binding protein